MKMTINPEACHICAGMFGHDSFCPEVMAEWKASILPRETAKRVKALTAIVTRAALALEASGMPFAARCGVTMSLYESLRDAYNVSQADCERYGD